MFIVLFLAFHSVVEKFVENGFRLLELKSRGGLKGLRDEVGFLRDSLRRVSDGHSLAKKVLRNMVNELASGFSGHVAFYVFRKV